MDVIYQGAKEIRVENTFAYYGLIYLEITLDDKYFVTNFSDAYDPLYAFKHWLEAICIGVEQCSFSFDTEGDEIRFDFRRRRWNDGVFTVKADYGEVYLADYVEVYQLVEAFYCGFLKMGAATGALRGYAQFETFGKRFKNLFNIDEESLIDVLASLNRRELKKALFSIDPWYCVRERKRNGKTVITKRPELFRIKKEYDEMPELEKRKYIEGYLWIETCLYNGAGISDFRSEMVESFLKNTDCPFTLYSEQK
jgi:hypothetical protein